MEKWVTGEPITAEKMNQIGDSIDNANATAIEALQTANSMQDESIRLKNALTQVATLTGNPIVITNALAMTPNNITIEITPTQDGVPTPSTPIDINSYSMIALTRTDGTGGNSATRFIDLDFLAGGSVYGGEIVLNEDGTNTLLITWAKALINTKNMSSWSAIIPDGGTNRIFYCGLNARKLVSAGTTKVSWSNAFDYAKATTMAKLSNELENGEYGYQQSNKRMGFRDDRFVDGTVYETSTEMIEAFLEAHANDYVVYELETPIEIPINIMKLSLLDGENILTNDAGLSMTLAYREARSYTDSTLTKVNTAADAKAVGEELADLRSHNPYKCIQQVQNAGATATGEISSLTVIENKLFMFKCVTNSAQTTGNKIYNFNSDGTVTVTGNTFTSNIGYVNSVDWNPLTNYLVASHQPMAGDAEQIYALYLFPNVTKDTRAFDTAANGVIRIDIDMSIFNGSEAVFSQYQLGAVWGPDDFGKGDLLYVISDDSSSITSSTRRLALLQLGKGNNVFTYGTKVSGVSTNQFNGTFNVVNVWVQQWTAINGISQGSNDLTYWGGKIYELPAPTSTAGFPLMIHSFDDFGATWKTERILIPYRNANGTASKHEKKGITIYGEHIYIGSRYNGLYVLNRD